MCLNIQLNNQKHKSKHNFCKKIKKVQSLNLQLNKVFGDMLTFYTFIFQSKLWVVRYKDVHIHIKRERERASVLHTHTHGFSPYNTQNSGKDTGEPAVCLFFKCRDFEQM